MMGKNNNRNLSGNNQDTDGLPDDRQYRQIAAQVFGKEMEVDFRASANKCKVQENVGHARKRKQELTEQSTTYTWKPKLARNRKRKPVTFGRCLICYSIISEGDLTNSLKKLKFAALMDLINSQGESSPALGEAISKLSQSPYNCLCQICDSVCEEISSKQQIIRKLQQEILELQKKSLHAVKLSSAVPTKELSFSNKSIGNISTSSIESHLESVRVTRKCLLDDYVNVNGEISPERTDEKEVKSESELDESLIDWESSSPGAGKEDSVVDDKHSNTPAVELPIESDDPLSENDSSKPPGTSPGDLDPLPSSTDDIYNQESPPSPAPSNNSGSLFKPEGSMSSLSSHEYQSASDDNDIEDDFLPTENEEKPDNMEDRMKEKDEGEHSTASNNSNSEKGLPSKVDPLAAPPVNKSRWYDKQKCDTCGAILANKQNLQLHKQNVHEQTTARPQVCVHCGKAFKSRAYLSKHMNVMHKGKRYYVCLSDCKQGFTDVFTFKRHLSEKHSELSNLKIYHCALCPKSFVDTLSLQRHWKTHKPKKDGPPPEYKCEHCRKIFKYKDSWITHTKAHAKPFACHICSETFPNREPLQTHLLRKHNETSNEVFECGVCEKKFVKKASCKQHEKTHVPNSYEFRCEHCGKGFHHKGSLKVHERMHNGLRPFACDICSESFIASCYLKQHQINKHKDSVSIKLHQCADCGKTFTEKCRLERHMKHYHGPGDYKCDKCGCTFDKEMKLLIHIKRKCGTIIHGKVWNEDNGKLYYRDMEVRRDSENNLECPFASCQKRFTNKKNLSAHFRSIHDPKDDTIKLDLQCDQCGRKFTVPGALSAHIKGVHERGFSCDICGITRSSQSMINVHKLRDHQGVRPHVCEHCGKAFALKAALQVHLRHHTGERPYSCSVCAKSFIKRCNLTIHQRTLHPEMNQVSSKRDNA